MSNKCDKKELEKCKMCLEEGQNNESETAVSLTRVPAEAKVGNGIGLNSSEWLVPIDGQPVKMIRLMIS